jgi:hypothetical protein
MTSRSSGPLISASLTVRRVHGTAVPASTDRPDAQEEPFSHDPHEGDRRYGIVELTRTATRDELHHSRGRDP